MPPVILGQPKSLDELPLLSKDERNLVYGQINGLVTQGVPPEIPTMMIVEVITRIGATLRTYEDLVRDLSDALDQLANSASEKELVEDAHTFAALIEAARTALNAPTPVPKPVSPLAVGPGLSGGGGPFGGFGR